MSGGRAGSKIVDFYARRYMELAGYKKLSLVRLCGKCWSICVGYRIWCTDFTASVQNLYGVKSESRRGNS